jgi:hypothetical protein
MKYYETTFEEYVNATPNLHPELEPIIDQFPAKIDHLHNVIIYGPPGSGKYTQALKIIQKYSPSKLHYDKKVCVTNEKNEKKKVVTETKKKGSTKKEISVSKKPDFTYRISDIHYEVDMSLLGCNSKSLWHDIYFQIIDIVSVKPNKTGIILCKNFSTIYNEFLDVFYSYIKHPLDNLKVKLHFILLTEHVGFIPENILNSSQIISVKRPSNYADAIATQTKDFFFQKAAASNTENGKRLLAEIDPSTVMNLKELYVVRKISQLEELPEDIEYVISEKLIDNIKNPKQIQFSELRNQIYDLLVYNVNVSECIAYILFSCIEQRLLDPESITDVLEYSHTFFKYYNNNYRSIYHLESIVFFIINKIHFKGMHEETHEPPKSVSVTRSKRVRCK